MKCPFNDCTFEGTEAQVDSHVTYMTGSVNDKDHAPEKLKDRH